MRLQTIIPKSDYREYKMAAKNLGISLADWVRTSLQKAVQQISPGKKTREIKEALRLSSQYHFPTADIDQMLAEIDQGRSNNGLY